MFSAIGSKKISELTNISDLNHEMIYANVPEPSTTPANAVKYGLTDRGQKWSELESDWAAGARPIVSTTNPLYGLTVYSVIKNDNSTTIIKSPNKSNYIEFRFSIGVT